MLANQPKKYKVVSKDRVLNFRKFPSDLIEQADEIAKKSKTNRQNIFERALKAYIESSEYGYYPKNSTLRIKDSNGTIAEIRFSNQHINVHESNQTEAATKALPVIEKFLSLKSEEYNFMRGIEELRKIEGISVLIE